MATMQRPRAKAKQRRPSQRRTAGRLHPVRHGSGRKMPQQRRPMPRPAALPSLPRPTLSKPLRGHRASMPRGARPSLRGACAARGQARLFPPARTAEPHRASSEVSLHRPCGSLGALATLELARAAHAAAGQRERRRGAGRVPGSHLSGRRHGSAPGLDLATPLRIRCPAFGRWHPLLLSCQPTCPCLLPSCQHGPCRPGPLGFCARDRWS
mmetsp:Transcript_50839/g.147596  ORF Transcript_50839/g.147596 Transcript_50839/m.147596 type:complete len:211 (-) Transcript_50839:207-839(-)